MKPHPLHHLFAPKHIAVIGASDRSNSVGQRLFTNLLAGSFKGQITPVNIRHQVVGGLPAYDSVTHIPGTVDMAIVLTRISSLPAIFKECHRASIRYVMLVKTLEHVRPQDQALLKKAVDRAKKMGIRVLGPSLLGLIRSDMGLNASIYHGRIQSGNLAVVSQSSALCAAMLDWADRRNIGFSTVLSLGEKTWDVDFGEILDYLVNDRDTHAILLHINHVSHGRKFISALRAAARVKPVLVIKSGHDNEHGADAGIDDLTPADRAISSAEVFASVVARAGVLQVSTISQMFVAVKMLAAHYRTEGNRLAIVCNGIGLGILAADTAYAVDVPLARLTAETMAQLNNALPENWSHANPVDVVGDAGPLRFRTAVKLCLADEQVDGVLVIFSPQIGTDHLATAQMMLQLQNETAKPILLSWLGDGKVKASRTLFNQAKRVQFNAPDEAIRIFKKLSDYHRNQQLLHQTPGPLTETPTEPDFATAHRLLRHHTDKHQYRLTENDSKQILDLFGIRTNRTLVAANADEACAMAAEMGYPVILKINSPDHHVAQMNIHHADEMPQACAELLQATHAASPSIHLSGFSIQPVYRHRFARELAVSVTRDPVFGPVIALGAGGWAGHIQQQRALVLPPLNDMLIHDLLNCAAVGKALKPYHNTPAADISALRQTLLRLSEMVCALPEMTELHIDPLIATPDGVLALDARITLSAHPVDAQRYGHMAIMPYPHFLETHIQLKNGSDVFVRPLRPEDADMVQTFVRNLSDESRYNRFMSSIKQLSQNVLVRFTQLDYDREMALVMITSDVHRHDHILSIARYTTDPDMEVCEFAISVSDQWQGRGIGVIMMNLLFDAARHQGLTTMRGEILTANTAMQKLTRKLGFSIRQDPEDNSVCLVEKSLTPAKKARKPRQSNNLLRRNGFIL